MKMLYFATVFLMACLALPLSATAADNEAPCPGCADPHLSPVTATVDAAPPNEAAIPAAALAANEPLAQVIEDYRIGPSDLLEISVFQVPELSRTVRVNARGSLSLPLIGEIQAGGLTSQQLEALLAQKLQETYLQNPQVSVFIKEFVSQRVTVGGNVNRAGVFPISGKTTLMQAIAMAGGLDRLANEKDIRVLRDRRDGSREVLAYDLAPIRTGVITDPVLHTNDIVVVGKSGGKAKLKDFTETLRDLSIFGLFF